MNRRSIFATILGCLPLMATAKQLPKRNSVYWVMSEYDEICINGKRVYLGQRIYRSAALPFANKDEAVRWCDMLARLSEKELVARKTSLFEGLALGPGVQEAKVLYRVVEEIV